MYIYIHIYIHIYLFRGIKLGGIEEEEKGGVRRGMGEGKGREKKL